MSCLLLLSTMVKFKLVLVFWRSAVSGSGRVSSAVADVSILTADSFAYLSTKDIILLID